MSITPAPTPADPQSVPNARDLGVSLIRTWVPVGWGYLLAFLLTRAPEVHALLDTPQALAGAGAVVTALWYALWRALEPRLPRFMRRVLLGSSSAPTYVAAVRAERPGLR